MVIRTGLAPRRVHGEDGVVTGVEFDYVAASGNALEPTGETLLIPCDRVLKAIGQLFVTHPHGDALALEGRRIAVDEERRTSDPMIWAGGDCASCGEDLTVWAVQDGKLAAESIDRTLGASA